MIIHSLELVYTFQANFVDRYFFEVSFNEGEEFCKNSFLEYFSKAKKIKGIVENDTLEDIKEPDEVNLVKQLGVWCYLVEIVTYG